MRNSSGYLSELLSRAWVGVVSAELSFSLTQRLRRGSRPRGLARAVAVSHALLVDARRVRRLEKGRGRTRLHHDNDWR